MMLYAPLLHSVCFILHCSQACNAKALFLFLFFYTFLTTVTIYSIVNIIQSLKELILRLKQTWYQMRLVPTSFLIHCTVVYLAMFSFNFTCNMG